MQAEIKNVRLDRIKPNPHRDIKNYPINADKVEALMRSIMSGRVGLWPSIIARPVKGGYEQAFGHHRVRAAEEAGLTTIPIIEMELNDGEMLMYMARENSEDFGTEFLVSLNTWEAGYNFLKGGSSFSAPKTEPQPTDIARLFGWVTHRDSDNHEVLTHTANACSLAFRLIKAGEMDRSDFVGLTTNTAREIADRAVSHMTTLDKAEKKRTVTPAHAKSSRNVIGKAAKKTAKEVREGKVAPSKVRAATEENIYRGLGKSKAPMPKPLFDKFAYRLCADISGMLSSDTASVKLKEIETNLKHIKLEEDFGAVSAVGGELLNLSQRSTDWNSKLRAAKPVKAIDPKVTPLLTKRGE